MAPPENNPRLWSEDAVTPSHSQESYTRESRSEEVADEPTPNRWAGLQTRVASAVLLGLVAFICLWRGGFLFTVFIMMAALVMKKEWDLLVTRPTALLRAGGYAYVILPSASLLWLRSSGDSGLFITLGLIVVVSATDIGAYFIGRRFGRHKLAPVVSPGKTWEGLVGGILAATIAWILISPHASWWIAPIIAMIAQGGDLFESAMKRKAGVKDSGTLLPGHGGLLDRFDGYMFAAPAYALLFHSAGV